MKHCSTCACGMPAEPSAGPPWEFDRYRDGQIMAEGIRIITATSEAQAVSMAGVQMERGDILVLRAPSPPAAPPKPRDLQSLCDRLNEVFNTDDTPDELSAEARDAIEELWYERDRLLSATHAAQHGETGRMWWGSKDQIPKGYTDLGPDEDPASETSGDRK